MDRITEAVVTVGSLIIGVAILSVIVSRRSNTAGVLNAAGSAFSGALATAVSPVTGGGVGSGFSNGIGFPSFGFSGM